MSATVVSIREYDRDHLRRVVRDGRPLPFIYVGRKSNYLDGHPLANPFRINRHGRQNCLDRYRAWLDGDQAHKELVRELADEVRRTGKPLACWCGFWPEEADLICHAVLLAKRVNVILETEGV